MHWFYFPPLLNGVRHDWSFLHPVGSVVLLSGSQTVDLPDDFGGIEGRITVATDGSRIFGDLEATSETRVRQMYVSSPSMTGRPMQAAVDWMKGTTALRGQRARLYVFPQADADYTLEFGYYILADALTSASPYHYGGMAHADTVRQACRAAAEIKKDNLRPEESGEYQMFIIRLQASVAADQKYKPRNLGYNGDGSDDRRQMNPHLYRSVTFNGVKY